MLSRREKAIRRGAGCEIKKENQTVYWHVGLATVHRLLEKHLCWSCYQWGLVCPTVCTHMSSVSQAGSGLCVILVFVLIGYACVSGNRLCVQNACRLDLIECPLAHPHPRQVRSMTMELVSKFLRSTLPERVLQQMLFQAVALHARWLHLCVVFCCAHLWFSTRKPETVLRLVSHSSHKSAIGGPPPSPQKKSGPDDNEKCRPSPNVHYPRQ